MTRGPPVEFVDVTHQNGKCYGTIKLLANLKIGDNSPVIKALEQEEAPNKLFGLLLC